MRFLKRYAVGVLLISSFAYAGDLVGVLSDDEMTAGICILATSGVHTAISERQAGNDKKVAKRLLDAEIKKLHTAFSNATFLQGIADSWRRALDSAYELPIQAKTEDKQSLVSAVTQEAFVSCMNNVAK